MYVYYATLDRLIGPVSMAVRLDLGFRLALVVPIRLDGVAQPAREDRQAAQMLSSEWLALRERFVVESIQDKRAVFGRWFARVLDEDGACLNEALLESGLVGPFKSGEAED